MQRNSVIPGKRVPLDAIAIAASALCLVHCLMLPLLLVLVPTLTAILVVPESFHEAALVFAVPTSILALAAGFQRHRQLLPAIVVVPGALLLALGVWAVEARWEEATLTIAGALLLSIGHALNWRGGSR